MNAIHLFAGAGGLSLGMEAAGINVILANEIEKDFAKTHESNYPQVKVVNKDIHDVDFKKELEKIGFLGKVDILAGGPPCQGFSTVGKKDFSDPRNSLFEQFLRAVDESDPRYVIFENVSGFKRLYSGKIYKKTVDGLSARGFDHTSAVLNAKDYGCPQSRQRTIILAWKRGENEVSLPKPTHGSGLIPFVSLYEAISDLPEILPGNEGKAYAKEPQNEYQKAMRISGCSLTEHKCSNYGEKMRLVMSKVPAGGSIMDVPEDLRPKGYFKNTYARLLADQPCPTITRNFGTPSSSRCIHPYQNRALSTREGARVQGFPDHYKFQGGKSSKNLQIGNAVPPILGRVLAEQIIKSSNK
jgi:DNA (cytosine-5)-methyltransferase 1